MCKCVRVLLENTASSFFRSGLDARERVLRLKKITARRVLFHRHRRATMAASVLITCYNISERALAKSPNAF